MKKRFQRMMEKIHVMDSFNQQMHTAAGSAAGIPAIYQMASSFFTLNMATIGGYLDDVYLDLLKLYKGQGPQATLLRGMARLKGGAEVLEANQTIRDAYPPIYPRAQQINQRDLLEGLISRSQNVGYTSEKGVRMLDLGPRLEAIDNVMSAEWWANLDPVTINASSRIHVLYFTEGFEGRLTARLRPSGPFANNQVPITVTIKYGNMCDIALHYTLHYRMNNDQDKYSRQVYLTHTGPVGWALPDPRMFEASPNLRVEFGHEGYGPFNPQFVGVVNNYFEGVEYPVTSELVSHHLVKDLFEGLFKKMGVDYQKMAESPFADPKFVYQATKKLMEAIPLPPVMYRGEVEPQKNILDTHVTAGLMDGRLIEHAYYQECCTEYKLVDAESVPQTVPDWGRIHPIGEGLVAYGTVLQYYARYVNGPHDGYNVALVLNDRTEEATFHLVYNKILLEATMTPQTVELFLASLEMTRTNLHKRGGDLS